MYRQNIFSLLILFFLFSFVSLNANDATYQYRSYHLMDKILENQNYCIEAFEGNKIFIRPENIISTNQGLFIKVNEKELYKLPLIKFNKRGHYIEGVEDINLLKANKSKEEKTKGPCPYCEVKTDKYGYCRNDDCPLCGFKVL